MMIVFTYTILHFKYNKNKCSQEGKKNRCWIWQNQNWVPRIDLSRDPHVPTLLGISVVIWYHQSISDNFRKYKSTDLSAISSRDGLKQLFWQRMYGWLYEIIPCLLRPPSPNGFYFTVILGALNQKKMLPCPGKIPLGAVTVSTKSLSESLIMELLQAVSLDDI